MILESLVTSQNQDATFNVAPMGPIVDESLTRLLFRPFQTSRTFQNLVRTRAGVMHVVDDVLVLARAALGKLDELPPVQPADVVSGVVLLDCCRWYEFEVTDIDDSNERAELQARVVHMGRMKDFFGFNRARHAVLEAAILATRLHIIPAEEVRAEMNRLRSPVEKTCGPRELEAFQLVESFINDTLASQVKPA